MTFVDEKARQSLVWKKKSVAIKKKYPFCFCCGATNKVLHIHHNNWNDYKTIIDYISSCDILVLCVGCHYKYHINIKLGYDMFDIRNKLGVKIELLSEDFIEAKTAPLKKKKQIPNKGGKRGVVFTYNVEGVPFYTHIRYYINTNNIDIKDYPIPIDFCRRDTKRLFIEGLREQDF